MNTSARPDPVVQFRSVTKMYGNSIAVDDLNLSIERGQFVTLLGPSGCGKSTTLRMVGGFETPNSGQVLLNGADVTHLPPNKRNVNIVFQDYALFPHLSVARNIAFGLEMKGMKGADIHKRVSELLRLVQMESFADRAPAQLSGGQRQRIALMRALAPDPQVLLLDEPLSALDAKLRHQMQIELKSIQQSTGKTFLFVTHDQEEALTMSDVVIVMNAGKIEQMGPPEILYSRPKTRFVANFIGEANLLTGRVLSNDGTTIRVDWNGVEIIADAADNTARAGDAATIVLRPENIHINPSSTVSARIVRRMFKGNKTTLSLMLGNREMLDALIDPATLAQIGGAETVNIGWDAGRAIALAD